MTKCLVCQKVRHLQLPLDAAHQINLYPPQSVYVGDGKDVYSSDNPDSIPLSKN